MKKTTEEFIIEANKVHNNKYDYSKTVYTGANNKVIIICPGHEEFQQKPSNHLRGSNGCHICGHQGRKNTINTEQFIKQAQSIHGTEKFDYTKTIYTRMEDKINIKCIKHDKTFQQNPRNHLKGLNGCTECNGQTPITLEKFIKKSKQKHGETTFDYSLIKPEQIKNMHSKIQLKCNKHNKTFIVSINSHIRGAKSCPDCNTQSPMTKEKFLRKTNTLFLPNNFNYEKIEWENINVKNKYPIYCNKHKKTVYQTLDLHLSGRNPCQKCSRNSVSKLEENFTEFIQNLGFTTINNSRKILGNGKEIDIYIPDKKIAIEFNGLYWHSEKFKKDKNYHYNKTIAAENIGIRLLHIWSDDWINKQDIVKKHIKHVLGINNGEKIYARKTTVKQTDRKEAEKFFNNNHIQGYVAATKHLGLYYNNEIVALGSFTKIGENYRLDRYATSKNVVGGHSKIVSHFEKENNYNKLITFADRTFSDGNLYDKTGWIKDTELKPDYSYIINGCQKAHKFGYRKSRFKRDPKLKYEENMTEKELAKLNNFVRLWDAGKIRYVKPKPSIVS